MGHRDAAYQHSQYSSQVALVEDGIALSDVERRTDSIADSELQDDEHPYNWHWKVKSFMLVTISLLNFIDPLSTSMISPCIPAIAREFNSTSETLTELSVSIGLLGLAVGAVFICPLSENVGRLPIFYTASLLFVVFTVGCALSTTLDMLIGLRFLQGLAASVPPTLGGPTIADMISMNRRGPWVAAWAVGPLLGPVLGPVCGGYIAQNTSWRWVFWILAIIAGVICLGLLAMRESYVPVLINQKSKRFMLEAQKRKNLVYRINTKTASRTFFSACMRPLKILFFSPTVLLLSVYVALNYGYLYLLFTSLSSVFADYYQFSEGNIGLAYLGLGVGMMFGMIFCGIGTSVMITKKTAKGIQVPLEERLKLMIPGAICTPISLFWYGWTVQTRSHFMLPITATALLGFGLLSNFLPVLSYLVDVFGDYAASAVAANTILRAVVGTFFPLLGPRMFSALGQGWGSSVLAFVSLGLVPFPILFVIYGSQLRTRFPVKLE